VQILLPLKKTRKKYIQPEQENTGLEKRIGGKMFVGTDGLFAHPMSMITTVVKPLLGNGDRW